jgi:hypothetical protein
MDVLSGAPITGNVGAGFPSGLPVRKDGWNRSQDWFYINA